jgi:pyruvate/oxaloacetate carboxyltransferase
MRTASMLDAAPILDECGFDRINLISGSAFETAVVYLFEDPWERLHLLRKRIKKTDTIILIRGRNLFGWKRYSDDVVDLFMRTLKNIGIDWVLIFDALNDVQNVEFHVRCAKKLGMGVLGYVTYSLSPAHRPEHFVEKSREFMACGADGIVFGDASGLLTAETARENFSALRKALPNTLLEFSGHDATGLSTQCYQAALDSGIDGFYSVARPVAYGESLPATRDLDAMGRRSGFSTRLDDERLRRIDDHFLWVAYQEGRSFNRSVTPDAENFRLFAHHQVPGGMMSHLVSQLKALNLIDRLPEVLEETGRVREEMGFPVMVTPFSQLVTVQATFNVLEGKRYHTVPEELRLYMRGHYGRAPGQIDQNILDLVVGNEDTVDSTAVFGREMVPEFIAENGPFASEEDLLLELFNSKIVVQKYRANCKPVLGGDVPSPLTGLVQEMAKHSDVSRISMNSGSISYSQHM